MSTVPLEDQEIWWKVRDNPNLAVPYYLIFSYLYYCKDISAVHDSIYDAICFLLYNKWNEVSHWHKFLIDREALREGTGYYISEDQLPNRVRYSAIAFARKRGIKL